MIGPKGKTIVMSDSKEKWIDDAPLECALHTINKVNVRAFVEIEFNFANLNLDAQS